jgi:hypothetical protein
MIIDLLLKRLQYKGEQPIVLINHPGYFKFLKEELEKISPIVMDVDEVEALSCALIFVQTKAEIDLISRFLAQKAKPNALIWMAYPKKSSKGYQSQLSRDVGWDAMGRVGYEPVRQIMLNEDWSAIRFKKVEEIQKMTRKPEMRLTKNYKK